MRVLIAEDKGLPLSDASVLGDDVQPSEAVMKRDLVFRPCFPPCGCGCHPCGCDCDHWGARPLEDNNELVDDEFDVDEFDVDEFDVDF